MATDPKNNLTLLWMQAQPVLEAYLSALVRDRSAVEDLLQQTALTCTEKFDQFDTARPFTGWAMGIARNKALQFFDRSGTDRHRFSSELIGQLAATTERLTPKIQDQREALVICIDKLPPKSRALVERRYVQDLKPGKIAESLGLSPNAVRIALHRVRDALRKCIEQQAEGNPSP